MLLLTAAVMAGLVNYGFEWWHFSSGDRACAYVKGDKNAIYGLVEGSTDPILKIKKKTI